MMLKKNKKFFIASCIVILLPMFAGFLLWDQLPAQVATHFGRNGEADRYSSKLFAVAGIYLFVLAMHIYVVLSQNLILRKGMLGLRFII